jgi:uncharacterized coiled-coil protein SlyX
VRFTPVSETETGADRFAFSSIWIAHLPVPSRAKGAKKAKASAAMDRQFLEFLGSFFINAAKGQKQLEDMTRWIGGGFSGFDELTRMFCKFYGINGLPSASPDYAEAWEKASENFKKSYHEWLNLMNVIPKSEYQILQKKCEALEEKIAAQDETIRHLRNLLSDKGLPYADAVEGFTRMMEKQGHQFQQLMDSLGKAFKRE